MLLGGIHQFISNKNILQCSHLTVPVFSAQGSWARLTWAVFIWSPVAVKSKWSSWPQYKKRLKRNIVHSQNKCLHQIPSIKKNAWCPNPFRDRFQSCTKSFNKKRWKPWPPSVGCYYYIKLVLKRLISLIQTCFRKQKKVKLRSRVNFLSP